MFPKTNCIRVKKFFKMPKGFMSCLPVAWIYELLAGRVDVYS